MELKPQLTQMPRVPSWILTLHPLMLPPPPVLPSP
jgi:hypothetical protein